MCRAELAATPGGPGPEARVVSRGRGSGDPRPRQGFEISLGNLVVQFPSKLHRRRPQQREGELEETFEGNFQGIFSRELSIELLKSKLSKGTFNGTFEAKFQGNR